MFRNTIYVGLLLLLAQLATASGSCTGACVKTHGKCGGKGIEGYRRCCSNKDQCVYKNNYYSQCRPKSKGVPKAWTNGKVVSCNGGGGPSDCEQVYLSAPLEDACGSKCDLPGKTTSASSQSACASACNDTKDCNCAVYDADSEQCAMKWTPCNSAVLGLQRQASGPELVALQPCRPTPLPIDRLDFPLPAGRIFDDCKPYTIFPGIMVVDLKPRRIIEAASAADCARTCAHNYLEKDSPQSFADAEAAQCNSFTYYPAAVASGSKGLCELYAHRFDKTSPHNYVEVLATDGLGIVSGSYCTPLYVADDNGKAIVSGLYPLNPIADTGVDWAEVCADSSLEFDRVPNQVPKCGFDCAVFPDRPGVKEEPFGEGVYYAVDSEDQCRQDCADVDECTCAIYRTGEACHLSNAPCSDPVDGTAYDPLHVRAALAKCSKHSPGDGGPADGDDEGLTTDFYGTWDDVCVSHEEFTYGKYDNNILVGPKVLLPGVHPTTEDTSQACIQRCRDLYDVGCEWAVYEPEEKRCTLTLSFFPRTYVPPPNECSQAASGCPPGAKRSVMTLLCPEFGSR